MTVRRPGYREAVEWIALNDDVSDWIESDGERVTVTGAMVRDLYGVEPDRLLRDIQRVIKREREN